MSTDRYRTALKKLRAIVPDDQGRSDLESTLRHACEAARNYNPEADPYAQKRCQIRQDRERRAALARAVRTLGNACKAQAAGLSAAIAEAERRSAVEIRDLIGRRDSPPDVAVTMARLMVALEAALDAPNENIDPGAAVAQARHGNIRYTRDITFRRPPMPDAMLAFEIEQRLRQRAGKPHCAIVALFVQAAFPNTALTSARAVKDRLAELPAGAELGGWPAEGG